VVTRQQLAPALVTELCRPLGRSDDVSEKHSGEHTVRVWSATYARRELLYFVQHLVLVANQGR